MLFRSVFEVGAADVFNTGFLAAPKKQVKVPTLLGRDADQFLKAMDIVVVIKGSVGKVSIAPLETPPAGPGGWVVGQSFAIVRVDDPFYAQLLVVFLRSGVGQGLIRRLVAGAAIPFLQIKELRQLEVPAPSADKLRRAQELLTRQQLLRDQIQVLQTELAAINFAEWELP